MTDIELNIISASAIGLVILAMAVIKNGRLKAFVYSLPIPITVTLVATGGNVNANHPAGLLLASLFLWSVFVLNRSGKVNIFLSDIIAALCYIGVGYSLIQIINISFYWAALIYLILWLVFVFIYRPQNQKEDSQPASKISPIVKFIIVFIFAYVLLSLKSYLSSVIVTFPFSGVFAVVEGREILETLAATFARNSLAILAMFAVMYALDDIHLGMRIAASWGVYLIVLKIITVLFPMSESKKIRQ